MDNATRIELGGIRLVHEEEIEGGVNVESGELDLRRKEIEQELRCRGHAQKGDKREESSERGRATQSQESNPHAKRRWKGEGGKGFLGRCYMREWRLI